MEELKANNTFVTSDLHYGHDTMLKEHGDNRPFESLEEMHNSIKENWNKTVGHNDHVFFLGDLTGGKNNNEIQHSLDEYLSSLNGFKYWILGNHDYSFSKRKIRFNRHIQNHFLLIEHLFEINVDGYHIILCHYPLGKWNRSHYGSFHLYGHCHGNHDNGENSLDMGINIHGYRPLNINEIINKIKK